MSHKSFPYARIATFGQLNKTLQTDPVGYSIYKDIDACFDIGPTSRLFGPEQPNAQLYMAEKCSKNWDESCELLSRNNDGTKCNAGKIESPLFKTPSPPGMTIGDFLVENSAVLRFCDLSSCKMSHEPYNPMDPASPYVTSYGSDGYAECLPVCKAPENPDSDIVLNKVLDKPHLHIDLLVNMYRNVSQADRPKYAHTRLGMIFGVLDAYFMKNK